MPCLVSAALTQDCSFILGGLAKMAVANKTEFSAYTTSSITMSGAAVFYEMEFAPGTGSFTNELVVSNGQKYVNQGISFQIGNKNSTTLAQAPNLALGKFVAVCKDRAGSTYLLGTTGYGLQATVTSLNSGAAEGDFGGLAVTMTNGATNYAVLYTGTVPGITNW